jgi:hypothetical protein
MYETTKGVREYTCMDLSLSFIFPMNNGLHEDFTSSVSLSVYQKDVPESLAAIIENAIEQCFTQYNERLNKGWITSKIISTAQLNESPLEKSGYFNCIPGKKPRKGIYHTWFDFRDNFPDTSVEFKIFHYYNPDHPKLSKAYLKFPNGSEPKEIWGFSDGDSLYINGGFSYSLLTREKDGFITYSRSSDYTKEVISAAIFGSIVGGFIGASLLGGVAAVTADPNFVEKFRLDPFNGKLLPFDAPDYTLISSKVVLYLSKVSDPNAIISIFIDGKRQCELLPGKYFTLDLSCHHDEVTVHLVSSTGGEKIKSITLTLFKTNAYLVKVNNDRTIDFKHLIDQMKKDILRNRTNENTTCTVEWL